MKTLPKECVKKKEFFWKRRGVLRKATNAAMIKFRNVEN